MQVKNQKDPYRLHRKAMKVANSISHIVGQSLAVRIGWETAKFLDQLKYGEVNFQYLKKSDLSQRTAVGTLNKDLLPLPKSGKTEKKKNHAYVCYFDVEKQGFRSFHVLNFNGVSTGASTFSFTQKLAA